MPKTITWKESLHQSVSQFSDSKEVIDEINNGVTTIAREWIDYPIDKTLPYYSHLCLKGNPLQLSIKMNELEKPNIRIAARPYCYGLNNRDLNDFIQIRAKEFIKEYSGSNSEEILDRFFYLFDNKNELEKHSESSIFLGLGLEIDIDDHIINSKLYLDTRSISSTASSLGVIYKLLELAGFASEESMEPILKYMTKYNAKTFGAGVNFYPANTPQIKVYLNAKLQNSSMIHLIQRRKTQRGGYNRLLLKKLQKKTTSGKVSLELTYINAQDKPREKFGLYCSTWFESEKQIIADLIQDYCNSITLISNIDEFLREDENSFEVIRIGDHEITIYMKPKIS